jgi:hypothetical protein
MEPDVAERHKGYRVFAIDGTDIEIEPTKENLKYYGTKGSGTACRAKASFLCEAIDGVIVDAIIGDNGNERASAKEHIEYFSRFATEKDLTIFDRDYPGKDLTADLFRRNIKFLMRLQRSFEANIDADKRSDFYADTKYKGATYRLRAIKFLLESGEADLYGEWHSDFFFQHIYKYRYMCYNATAVRNL